MTQDKSRILLVDDYVTLAESIGEVLEMKGFAVKYVSDGDTAILAVEKEAFHAVLTDVRMPAMGGLELLDQLRKMNPQLPVVLMTAFSTTDRAIDAIKRGAYDFILKPLDMPELLDALSRACETGRLSVKKVVLDGSEDPTTQSIVGSSRAMQKVYKEIGRLASVRIPVLIKGETGTGKELIARAICQHSDRATKPFVAINCAAIPDNLIESELFGHERGALTGATNQRIGRFEQANGGTLFFDEIGDLAHQTQVKFLRVLQEQVITRVGGKSEISVDVRILSATHRDLPLMIKEGTFREDLYYRLAVSTIQLPPLRERPEDAGPLFTYFLRSYAVDYGMNPPAIEKYVPDWLQEQSWPGNVRQMENFAWRAMVESAGLPITVDILREIASDESGGADSSVVVEVSEADEAGGWANHIETRLLEAKNGDLRDRGAVEVLQEEMERELYRQAVKVSFGNQTKMSKWLGVSRLTVRDKLDKFDLFPKRKASTKEG